MSYDSIENKHIFIKHQYSFYGKISFLLLFVQEAIVYLMFENKSFIINYIVRLCYILLFSSGKGYILLFPPIFSCECGNNFFWNSYLHLPLVILEFQLKRCKVCEFNTILKYTL